jgi:PIN domain nuclease of toxin-antitoxin system
MEIATKFRLGKLPGVAAIAPDLASAVAAQGFIPLPISFAHGHAAGALPGLHKDPFDRMLAMLDGMVLVSNKQHLDSYGVRRLW